MMAALGGPTSPTASAPAAPPPDVWPPGGPPAPPAGAPAAPPQSAWQPAPAAGAPAAPPQSAWQPVAAAPPAAVPPQSAWQSPAASGPPAPPAGAPAAPPTQSAWQPAPPAGAPAAAPPPNLWPPTPPVPPAPNPRVQGILLGLMRERGDIYAGFTDVELRGLLQAHSGDVAACHETVLRHQAAGAAETTLEDNETAPAAVPAPANVNEDAMPTRAECVEAISAAAANFVCPITQALPTEPVTAEDGHVYERGAIASWFRAKDGDPTSPITGARMGTRLLEAHQVRNTIEALVKSGAIDGEVATAWKQKLADEALVTETRVLAEGGDGDASYRLGVWYEFGMNGLAKDNVQARAWYERSAAARNPKGMARFGEYLLLGVGGPQNYAHGLVMAGQAAALGSDHGAYLVGKAFSKGLYGLPKDPAQARYWLKKIFDGECEHKHLNEEGKAKAARFLRELDETDDDE